MARLFAGRVFRLVYNIITHTRQFRSIRTLRCDSAATLITFPTCWSLATVCSLLTELYMHMH